MTQQTASTKERILQSAGVIFGKKGFKNSTIREIAKAAQVNIAAINYHFQGKEGLYGAVLEDVFQGGFSRFPPSPEPGEQVAAEERLYFFIKAMFYRLQSREGWGGMSGQGRLIARELLDPSPSFEAILDRYINPQKELLLAIISEIMQVDAEPEQLMPCAISIIGQCIYYALASTVIRKISMDKAPAEERLDQSAHSVWLFSLGGIARMKEEISTPPKVST